MASTARRPSHWLALASISAGLGGWLSAATSPAAAQEVSAGAPLTFVAPETCPGRGEFIAEVERILARPWSALPEDFGIAVQLDALESGFALGVSLAEGERTLRDGACRPLVLAAALIVALAIDPEAALLSASTPVEVEVPVPVPVVAEREAPRRDLDAPYDPRPRPVPPPLLGLGAGVALDVGLLPQPSAGPAIEVVVRIDAFDLRVGGSYLAPTAALRDDGVGAEVSAWLGALHGCFRPAPDPRLAICAGLQGGALVGRALGPVTAPNPGASAGGWLAVGAGLWLPWAPWDALDIELSIEGLLSVVRPRFEIDGLGAIFEPVTVNGRLGLTVHLDLRP